MEYQGPYHHFRFKEIPDFDSNPDDIFDRICMMDDFLQTVSSKVTIYHTSFKLISDALDWWEEL